MERPQRDIGFFCNCRQLHRVQPLAGKAVCGLQDAGVAQPLTMAPAAGTAIHAGERVGSGWNVFDAILAPGDFDGSGTVDVAARDRSGALYLYNTDGTGGWHDDVRTIGRGWGVMRNIGGAGDFDRDGNSDVFAVGFDGHLFAYYGNGAGGWISAGQIGSGWEIFTAVF